MRAPKYQPLCHPEPQAESLWFADKDEIIRHLRRLRMTTERNYSYIFEP